METVICFVGAEAGTESEAVAQYVVSQAGKHTGVQGLDTCTEVPSATSREALPLSASNSLHGTPFWAMWSIYPTILCHTLIDSLIAQLVKNLPAMQETPVCFQGQEEKVEEG